MITMSLLQHVVLQCSDFLLDPCAQQYDIFEVGTADAVSVPVATVICIEGSNTVSGTVSKY